MRKWTTLLLAATMLLSAFLILPVQAQGEIYDSVIRLHVLANSDSEKDQALKLEVRDAVLAYTERLLADAKSMEEANGRLRDSLSQIREIAERTLAEKGESYTVAATLTKETYPRRIYETAALPAGEYLSLQVKIGEAAGQNWWCVLFPPLCLSAAAGERETACLSAGLTEEQYRLITETEGTKYKLRFKILEVAEELFG